MSRKPVISVIFPLPDYRGYLDEILESWISGQTLDSDAYELLLMSGPSDAEKLKTLEPRLRDHDDAQVEEEDGILYLMDCAAKRARGEILLLTESHCFAHPECLENLVRHFAGGAVDLAQCFHINILETRYAEMEQRLEGIMIGFPEEPYWNCVRKRGFAIRRDLYRAMGGFEHEFGYFSERAFAYRLLSEGHRSEFFREAIVYHYNTPTLAMMRPHHEDYAEGMCLYRETMPSAQAEEAFGRFALWDERERFRCESRMTAFAAATRSWSARGFSKAGAWSGFAVRSMRTLGLERFLNECCTRLASLMARCFPGAGGAAYRWYQAYWKGIVKRVHLRTIRNDLRASRSWSGQMPTPGQIWSARALTDLPHWGFHGLETIGGREFRWSDSFGFVRIPGMASPRVELVLQLHPSGPGPEESGFDLRLGGRGVLDQGNWDAGERLWRGRVDSGNRELLLTFISWNARQFPGDERRLGVAIESLRVRPAE